MEQVRLCAVWPTENWLGSSMNQVQGWKTVLICYCHALETGCLSAINSWESIIVKKNQLFAIKNRFSVISDSLFFGNRPSARSYLRSRHAEDSVVVQPVEVDYPHAAPDNGWDVLHGR